ncbi:MAG: alpha/beta hydrolase [Clostridia bacterium]|nr:alpha/beta hydrolase [Clostridia bacterium]
MTGQMIEQTAPSTDGVHTLHGYLYLPQGEIVGAVQIVHGMSEHIERYDTLMRTLAERGYAVFGHDHIGHGRSVDSDEELGFLAHQNGWNMLIEDVGAFADAVMPSLPVETRVLFGHSMGSFVVRLYAARHSEQLSRLIVMGTGGPNPAAGVGIALGKMIRGLYGDKHVSTLMNALAFANYNQYTEKRTLFDWLSTRPENVQAYIDDPYCGFPFTTSAMIDLVTLNKRANQREAFAKVRPDLPILLVSGEKDPVGDYGKGVAKVAALYRTAGVQSVDCTLYPDARHEILNDRCENEVMRDLLAFVQAG